MARRGWDVIIVGSGAGGGSLALALSRAGLRVLVLEKGPRYERQDYRHDELLLTTTPDFFIPSPALDPHVLVDETASTAEPRRTSLGWLACCVGGGTVRMGGSCYRFHPDDFQVRTRFGPLEEIEDWPYTYAELEPYYSTAEWEVGVSGRPGNSPYERPRSRPYPMPPLDAHPLATLLDRACQNLGYHAFTTPRAINSRAYGGRPACMYCTACGGYGCPVGARGSAQETLIARAERTGRCEVRANSMVREVLLGRNGGVTGCVYLDHAGAEHLVRASVVCVCCSAVESARLLLLSQSPQFPDGLGNRSGLVGRHLQFKIASTAIGRFWREHHGQWSLDDPNPFLGRSVGDLERMPAGAAMYAKGGVLRFDMERALPIRTAQRLAMGSTGRWLWGEPLKQRLKGHFWHHRDIEVEVFQDFVPNGRTFVDLDPLITDRWGLPAARIHLAHPDHHRTAARWLLTRGMEILDEMGADELITAGIGYVNPFLIHGTCRAGTDPGASVLDAFCRAHEVPNLFVVDGSYMPTSGAVPSTLTIIANGFRTADFIIDRARTGEFGSHRRRRDRVGCAHEPASPVPDPRRSQPAGGASLREAATAEAAARSLTSRRYA